MNCNQTQKYLNALEFTGENPKLPPDILGHLDWCSDCREEYRLFREAQELFVDLTPVEPVPSFGAAWRNRLHEVQSAEEKTKDKPYRFNLSFGWPRLVPVFGLAVLIAVVGFSFANHWWGAPVNPGNHGAGYAAQASGTYRLKIMSVGSQSKLVQRVIRDFRSSYEGGAAYTYRDPVQDLTAFQGLTLKQAQTLKLNLERAGASVKLSQEK